MAIHLFCVMWRSLTLSIQYVITVYLDSVLDVNLVEHPQFGWNESINMCGILYLIKELIGKGLSKWKRVIKKTSSWWMLQGIFVVPLCLSPACPVNLWLSYSFLLILFARECNRYGHKFSVRRSRGKYYGLCIIN